MSFYQSLLEKISSLERLIKDRELRDSNIPWYVNSSQKIKDGKIAAPWFIIAEELPDKIKLRFWKVILYFLRIWMIIIRTPDSNFNVFTQAGKDGIYICNYSFCYYKGFHKKTKYKFLTMVTVATIIVSLIVALVFPGKPYSKAATVSWIQSSWAGGASSATAKDSTDKTTWTNYADDPAADANITAGATVALAPIADSEEETTDAHFNGKWVQDTLDADFNQGNYGTPVVTMSDGAGGVKLIIPPGAPTGLTPTAGNAQVVLNWSAPSNGGSAITNYKIYRDTVSGFTPAPGNLIATIGNVLTYTNTGLTNGTTYYYKVSAVNAIGEGTQSSEASAMPVTTPSQVTGFSATAGNAQVVLNWSAPSNGGSAITSYKVYRGTASNGESLLSSGGCSGLGAVLTCTDTGLTNGTTYYYKVSAVNAIGEGSQSSEASIVPGYIYTTQCAGINIYYADLGATYTWKTTNTACDTPQCGINGGQDGDNLVDPIANSGVDFSLYPAQNACKAIGGRLPTKTELACIYTNRATMGTFQANYYWSGTEFNATAAWLQYFGSGLVNYTNKTSYYYVRCVRGQ